MTKKISPERKGMYSFGLVLQIIGAILAAIPFLVIPLIMMADSGDMPGPGFMLVAFIGFGLIVVGGGIRSVAARGTAGSGLILDPEKVVMIKCRECGKAL